MISSGFGFTENKHYVISPVRNFTLFLLFSFPFFFSFFHFVPVSSFHLVQSKQSSSYSDRDTTEDDSESLEDMDFLSRQKKLQAEAKLALAMAKPMAKMQVEVEKQNRKKSPVADLVSNRNISSVTL